tara:strand:+ start:19 stop:642 length:624 start_codon:yes stop_codon:yes gene_type:complete
MDLMNKKEQRKQWYSKNTEKVRESRKKWKEANPEKVRESNRKWNAKNTEKVREINRKWNAKNPEKRKEINRKSRKKHPETTKKWRKHKRATDPNWRLRQNLGTRISRVLGGTNKSANTMALIGCTIEELWIHLESSPKWEPWMTRENYGRSGGWDIDHIRPCVSFDLTDPKQQRICCNWSNLQPMEHIENIKKRDKIIPGDITSPKM